MLIAFPLQELLNERTSVLRYTTTACLVDMYMSQRWGYYLSRSFTDSFLNAPLRILNASLRKCQFYNSITTHQYKRFIRHQHESYNLGSYYAHPLLLIDAHPPLGINKTKALNNSSLKGITSDHVYALGISVICLLVSHYKNP